jgi:hypothetical protein
MSREERHSALDLRRDQLADEYTWRDVENAMADAPEAQKKAFWSELMEFLGTDYQFICKQNVSPIAAPLQDAVRLAIDEQIDREQQLEAKQFQEFNDAMNEAAA